MISIGRITKTVGVRGQLFVELFAGRPDRLSGLKEVFTGASESEVRSWGIESLEARRNGTVLKLQNLDGLDEAEALRGLYVFVEDGQRISLDVGTFFVHEIIGLRAVDENGADLGTVTDVLSLPGGDVWVVRAGQKDAMIPAVSEFIRRVDTRAGTVVIHTIEGLLE
ncbi:MAG TPA: ribosome maturation factor RimM [Bacteroidota bacterium]